MNKFKGTYILERFFRVEFDDESKVSISRFNPAIIRPCDTSYTTLKNAIKGLIQCEQPIIFKGAIVFYRPEETGMSFHEWLIDISLNRNIVPDIEKHICLFPKENPPWGKEHIMMEKDCHTNEILYVYPNYKDWPSRVNKILDT